MVGIRRILSVCPCDLYKMLLTTSRRIDRFFAINVECLKIVICLIASVVVVIVVVFLVNKFLN
jgi:hypothetical protein